VRFLSSSEDFVVMNESVLINASSLTSFERNKHGAFLEVLVEKARRDEVIATKDSARDGKETATKRIFFISISTVL
jgi:hypothetical protein